ncbi:MAG: tRNA uridine-5-carboxymethylaminomethyl(34) synthesis GTPase MnmE [Victivallaceae bacterium]
MNSTDTICALATAVGGAIAIVRVAGPRALEYGRQIWRGRAGLGPENRRQMLLGKIGGDAVLAVYMPGPASYTGDDVVEFHCHGGALAADAALRAALAAGCRLAEPGEFTFRAFINGKLDLVQAEAVGDLISAQSETALHLAERQLQGALSKEFAALRLQVLEVLAECESHLDFPDEALDWDDDLAARLEPVLRRVEALLATDRTGQVLREGIRVVIAGRPNAGKSSLLNALLGYERAIVTPVAGTTRDTLEESAVIESIPVRLTDTAGLRESEDLVEKIGVGRSRESLRTAEVVFWVLDASAADLAEELGEFRKSVHSKKIAVWNKIDLARGRELPEAGPLAVSVSAVTGENLHILGKCFAGLVWESGDWSEPEIAVNARHTGELRLLVRALPEAMELMRSGEWELAAIPLRHSLEALGRITGETADPDLLGNIFSRFCIGK